MNLDLLRLRGTLIHKDIAPKDTFNLANSIRSFSNGNRITWHQLDALADYGKYLEYGTKKIKQHIGWWYTKAGNATRNYIQDYYNGKLSNVSASYKVVALKAKTTPEREKAQLESAIRTLKRGFE